MIGFGANLKFANGTLNEERFSEIRVIYKSTITTHKWDF